MTTLSEAKTKAETSGTEAVTGFRTSVRYAIIGITVLVLLIVGPLLLVGYLHKGTPANEATTEGSATAGRPNICDGRVQTATLAKGVSKEINPDGRCAFSFEVIAGKIRFTDLAGSTVADWAVDEPPVGKIKKRIVGAQALVDSQVDYMLCPAGKGPTDDSWQCS